MNKISDGDFFRVPIERKSFEIGQRVVVLEMDTNPKKLHGIVGTVISYDPKIGYGVKVPNSEVPYYGFQTDELMSYVDDDGL